VSRISSGGLFCCSAGRLSSEESMTDLLKLIDDEDLSSTERLRKVADLRHLTIQFTDLPKVSSCLLVVVDVTD
jgi:hypothetical protein